MQTKKNIEKFIAKNTYDFLKANNIKLFKYYLIGITSIFIGYFIFTTIYFVYGNYFLALFFQFVISNTLKFNLYKNYLFLKIKLNIFIKITFFFYVLNNLFLYLSNLHFENVYLLQIFYIILSSFFGYTLLRLSNDRSNYNSINNL